MGAGTVLFAALYCAGTALSLAALVTPPLPAAIFLPAGIMLAALLLRPPRLWWPLYVAAFIAQMVARWALALHPLAALPIMIADAGRDSVAAVLLRRLWGHDNDIESLRGMTALIAVALAVPAVTGFAYPLYGEWLRLVGVAADYPPRFRPLPFWTMWSEFFLSASLAYLTIVPLGLSAAGPLRRVLRGEAAPLEQIGSRGSAEAWSMVIGVLAASVMAFGVAPELAFGLPVLFYLPIPFLIWGAVRFGPGGAALTLIIVAVVATASVVGGTPLLVSVPVVPSLLSLQLAILSLATPTLILAAIVRERERGYTQLRAAQARVHMATRAGHVYVMERDDATGRIIADPGIVELLGVGADALRSLDDFLSRVHPDDLMRLRGLLHPAPHIDGRPREDLEFRMFHRDGHVRWVQATADFFLLGQSGPPLVGMLTDITQQKDAELTADQHRRELAELSRRSTLGELGGAIAHEVRQPLTAMMSNAQTGLRLARRGDVPREMVEIFDDIVSDGRRAGEVIERMLALGRGDQAGFDVLDLNDVTRDVTRLVGPETLRRNVTWRSFQWPTPLLVRGDRVQLQQVALNLLLNAFDAVESSNGDRSAAVSLETRLEAPGRAVIRISDSGPGLDPERIHTVFDPFVTSKPSGLGLGLTICRTIVEAHDGTIGVERDDALGGAAFHVSLPLVSAPIVAPR